MGIPLQSTSPVMNPAICFTFMFLWSTAGLLGVAGQGRTCEEVLEVVTQEISSYQAGDRGERQAMHCRCNGQVEPDGSGECQTRMNSGGSDGRGGAFCFVDNTRFMRNQCGDFARHRGKWISFLACL